MSSGPPGTLYLLIAILASSPTLQLCRILPYPVPAKKKGAIEPIYGLPSYRLYLAGPDIKVGPITDRVDIGDQEDLGPQLYKLTM